MNFKFRLLTVLLAATAAQSALASDGTINFTGELKASTCDVSVNGQPSKAPATVALPAVSASTLAAAGQVTGQTSFLIQLSNCQSAASVAAFFEAGAGVDAISGNLKNTTGSAKQVQLQLVDAANGKPIKAGDTLQTKDNTRATVSGTTAVMPYAVQYFATGKAEAGTVLSSVTYSINYQ